MGPASGPHGTMLLFGHEAVTSIWLLPNHFVRILIFSDSEKNWLTEAIIPGPLREFDLADHSRLHPMATFHFGGPK